MIQYPRGEVKPVSDDIYAVLAAAGDKVRQAGAQNERIKYLLRLASGGAQLPDGLVALDGLWAHIRAAEAGLETQVCVICPELVHSEEARALARSYISRTPEVYSVSARLFERLGGRESPDGFFSLAELPRPELSSVRRDGGGFVVVLDGLESPGNIGTILRTADGAGADAVFVCGRRARLNSPKVVKSSMGALFIVPVFEFADAEKCRDWLRCNGFAIYLADERADRLYSEHEYAGNTALVVGGERYSLSEGWYGQDARTLAIPMHGKLSSLNAGVAASVIMYEICRRKRSM